jgi:hypothetical protein
VTQLRLHKITAKDDVDVEENRPHIKRLQAQQKLFLKALAVFSLTAC